MIKRTISLIFLHLCTIAATAQSPIAVYSTADSNIEIAGKVQVLEDKGDNFTIGQVIASNKFVTNTSQFVDLGFSRSAFWIKIRVKNTTQNNPLLVEISQASIDHAEIYNLQPDGTIETQKLTKWLPLSARKYKELNYIFDVDAKPNEIHTCFIKVIGDEPKQFTLQLGSAKSTLELEGTVDFFSGIYIGIMLAMLLYNLFIYFTVTDKSYIFYVIYIAFVTLTQTNLPQKYFWPEIPWIGTHSLLLFSSLAGITGLLFMQQFLKTKRYVPLMHKISYLFFIPYGLCIVFALSDKFIIGTQIMEPISGLVSLFMLFTAIRVFRKGYRTAKFFLIGWSIFLVGVLIFVFKDLGILPYNYLTRYTMQIGSVFDVLLLSLGLADRIKALYREKEEKARQLQKAYNELNRFSYSASHDLKAPLSTMKSIINLSKLDSTYESDEYLGMIETSVNQLDDFTTNILNYFLNQNKEQLSVPIMFESFLQKLIEQIKVFRNTSGIKFVINVKQTEPFYSDEFIIGIILSNLISNSIVHRDLGLKENKVEIDVLVYRRAATILVKDTGNGIAPEHLKHIFEMFYRASTNNAGSGLGLYIVKESMDTLDGTITVSSTIGKGTCFSLAIPEKKHSRKLIA
jgi:signal transduction histidine kinase